MLDTLTPQFAPQFRPDPRLYMTQLLERMTPYRAVRGRLEIRVAPDDSNAAVAAAGAYEGRIVVPNGSRLWAISGSSSQAAGFDLQIRNAANGQALFGRRTYYANATGQGGGTPSSPLFFLPKPQLILAETDAGVAQILVQAWNRAAAANTVQILLWLMAPEEQ